MHFVESNEGIESTNANKPSIKCGYTCSLKHLKSLYTFTDKSVQVADKSGQVVLADS